MYYNKTALLPVGVLLQEIIGDQTVNLMEDLQNEHQQYLL